MGNTNGPSQNLEVPINFRLIKEETHPVLGPIKFIIDNHDDSEYLLIERFFASLSEFQNCLNKVKSRCKLARMKQKYLPNQHIIQIVNYRTAEHNQLCGKTFKTFIFIHKIDYTFKYFFQQRNLSQTFFTEKELIELMLSSVNCLIELYDHNMKPFHLSLESMFLQDKNVKIIDRQLTSQMSPIDSLKYKSQLRAGTFIAPELLDQSYDHLANTSKSDIFTLGMLFLELASLESLDSVYDYNCKKINFGKIQSQISKIQFTETFKMVLRQMLQELPEVRIGILRLQSNLSRINTDQTRQNCLNNQNQHINQNDLTQQNYFINQNCMDVKSLNQGAYQPLILPNNKGLISLGKNPNASTHPSILKSNSLIGGQISESIHSYHGLSNVKKDFRNDKSISFNKNQSQNSDSIGNYRNPSFSKNFLEQTPQTNLDYTPQYSRPHEKKETDLEDTPISPVSLRPNQNIHKLILKNTKVRIDGNQLQNDELKQKKVGVDIYDNQFNYQSGKLAFGIPIKNIQNQQPAALIPKQYDQPFYREEPKKAFKIKSLDQNQPNQVKYISNQQPRVFNNARQSELKLKQNVSEQFNRKNNYFRQGQNLQISEFPSFSTLSSPNIQTIQTPRLIKHNQSKESNTRLNTNSFERACFPQETPIKSIELIQTERRQNNRELTTRKELTPKNEFLKENSFGRYDFSNGAVYQGEFNSQNQFEGNGVLYFPSGKIFYSGCWKKNQFHGFGILNNIEKQKQLDTEVIINFRDFNLNENSLWKQYEGEFYEDRKHGFGTLYFVNGDKFSGCFINDCIQGFGNFYQNTTQKTIMGIWANNIYREP